jgi:uncharacterized damage-inducible protein DinB
MTQPPQELSEAPDRVVPRKREVPPPPYVGDERPLLEAWLDFHRATLLWKCSGLDAEQLRQRSVPPSTMSLLGLVRHLTEVERTWFTRVLTGEDAPPLYYSDDDPDGDFDGVDDADAEADLARFTAQVATSRATATAHGLEDTGTRRGQPVSLRWIYGHMIEEYARHNGHADLLREAVDGATGD